MTRDIDTNGEISEDIKTDSDGVDRFEALLGSLQPQTRIVIERLQPSWCSGFLEEITLTDSLGLDYFIDTWGGYQLSVKVRGEKGRFTGGSHKIDLFSFPPLRWGTEIKQYDRSERYKSEDDQPQMNPNPVVVNPVNPLEQLFKVLPTIAPFFLEWSKAQEAKRQNELALMMNLMKASNGGGLHDITKVGAVMGQLNDMFKANSNTGDSGGEMDFLPHAMEVLKMAMAPKDGATAVPSPSAPRLPKKGSPSPPPPSAPRELSGPPQGPPQDNVRPLRGDISSQIAKMDPDEAADTVMTALANMEPEQRDRAMSNFIEKMSTVDDGDVDDDAEPYDNNNRGVR